MDMSANHIDTANYAPRSGISDGDKTYGTIVEVVGRYEQIDRMVQSGTGKSVFVSHVFNTETAIPVDSRFWPPGVSTANADLSLQVVRVETAQTLDGSYRLYDAFVGTF